MVIYALGGLILNLATLLGGAAMVPFVWLGLRIGGRIHTGLTHQQLRRVVGCMLVVIGASLVIRVLG